MTFKFFGKTLNVDMEFDSSVNKYHRYATKKGPLYFEGTYEFFSVPEGVRVVWNFRADPKGFFGLVPNNILRKALDKQADKDIRTLKGIFSNEEVKT